MKLTLLIFFLFSSFLFCMPSSADTLYRMDEKGIYYIVQDTVYIELAENELLSKDVYDTIKRNKSKAPVLRSYYDKREYVYKPFKWLIGGLIIGAGVTSSQWQIAMFSMVCGGIFILGG